MKRLMIGIFLVAMSVSAEGQPRPQAGNQLGARQVQANRALAQCHGRNALALARSDPSIARVVNRVLARCRSQENAVLAEVRRSRGPAEASRAAPALRRLSSQGVTQIVRRARGLR